MSKVMQNLVFFLEPSEAAWKTSMKAGNMWLNRFLIDEDAAFDLSGVNYIESSFTQGQEMKGKELSYFHIYTYTICCSWPMNHGRLIIRFRTP